jgi:hypothetical protein
VSGLQDMDDGIIVEEEDSLEDTENLLGQWETLDSHSVIVVDLLGVHQRRVAWCYCPEAPDKHIQLLRARLFPASIKRPSTVFTFNVLDYFHIDAVECKTAALTFFSKMRRLTNYNLPGAVPVSNFGNFLLYRLRLWQDRYRELMRVSRMWRNLISLKRAGVSYDTNPELKPGSFAIFCPSCPQPGVNIPDNWREDPRQ